MEKRTRNVIIVSVIIVALTISIFTVGRTNDWFSPLIVSGYDGMTAEIVEVTTPLYDDTIIDISGNTAQVNPPEQGFLNNPTKLNVEIDSAVDVEELISEEPPIYIEEDAGESKIVEEIQVNIYKCTIGVTIYTVKEFGAEAIKDVYVTIELYENDFSLFTDADDNYACILEVYNDAAVNRTVNGNLQVSPSSGSAPYVLTTMSANEIPKWLLDSGYNTESISELNRVQFDIHVLNAKPGTFLTARWEAQVSYEIAVDVFVAGYWKRVVDRDWEPPPIQDPWYQVFLDLGDFFGGLIKGPIMTIIIIVFAIGFVVVIIRVARR